MHVGLSNGRREIEIITGMGLLALAQTTTTAEAVAPTLTLMTRSSKIIQRTFFQSFLLPSLSLSLSILLDLDFGQPVDAAAALVGRHPRPRRRCCSFSL